MPTSPRHPHVARRVAAVAATLSLAVSVAATVAGAAPVRSRTALFAAPSAIAAVGPWIVVANEASSSLTVLTASKGTTAAHVRHSMLVVSAPTAAAGAVVAGKRLVFVAGTGGTVSRLSLTANGATNASAHRLGLMHPFHCGMKSTASLTTDAHGHLLEACSNGAVTEWSMASGAMVHGMAPAATRLASATGIAVLGTNLYVTSTATGAKPDGVTELSLASATWVRTVTNATNPAYAFSSPAGIASDGTNLWEINAMGNTVDELSGATLGFLSSSSTNLSYPGVVLATRAAVFVSSSGAAWSSSMVTQFTGSASTLSSPWMMCNTNGPYKFSTPSGFVIAGPNLWVANATDNLVDEMNATTGALVNTYT